ncbi:hypothetical protein ABZ153_14160 [Streptomyces sp. NPDC006290]|uniref:hypothetical protein n=1 Tax=Streptomyces sp. NPDC006290 TaxID=3156745 RepID=UPI0033A96BD8
MIEYTYKEGPWAETAVTLVVRKHNLDADLVARTISLPPTSVRRPGNDHRDRVTPPQGGLWALQVHDRMPGGLSDQLRALMDLVGPRSSWT